MSVLNILQLVTVVWDTCLLDTELARNVTIFYISQARLLLEVIKTEEKVYSAHLWNLCVFIKGLNLIEVIEY